MSTSRFEKIAADGSDLPVEAVDWAVVRDNTTGLEWQAGQSDKRLNHADALKYCASLPLSGGGWRLPTRVELLSLLDDTRHEPAIDIAFFPATKSNWYWTATPAAWSPSDAAWFVLFGYGYSYWHSRYYECFARAVRARQ